MRYIVLAASLAALSVAPAFAKPGKGWGGPHGKQAEHAMSPQFTAADATRLRVHFAQQPVVWTGLPPGIAKNYGRGKPLPPGIAKKLSPDVLAQLPRHPGYEYARVGQDVVLIEAATRIVVDVIERILN
jgi:hypothetical protein